MLPELQNAPDFCKDCHSKNWKIKRMIDSAERIRYVYICDACGQRTTAFCKKVLAEQSSLLIAGTINMPVKKGHCERCNVYTHLEEHHWAPYKIFGNDAESWPKSMLCRKCHEEWHQKVTGDLVRKV